VILCGSELTENLSSTLSVRSAKIVDTETEKSEMQDWNRHGTELGTRSANENWNYAYSQ
jgi:hypothetical protein